MVLARRQRSQSAILSNELSKKPEVSLTSKLNVEHKTWIMKSKQDWPRCLQQWQLMFCTISPEQTRRGREERGIWEKKKETDQSIHEQTLPTNPLFSSFAARVSSHSRLCFGLAQKLTFLGCRGVWCIRVAKEKEKERGMCGRREKDILAGSVVLPTSPIGLSEKAGMRETDWNRKGERGKQRGNSCGLAHCTVRGVAWCVFIL